VEAARSEFLLGADVSGSAHGFQSAVHEFPLGLLAIYGRPVSNAFFGAIEKDGRAFGGFRGLGVVGLGGDDFRLRLRGL
jgi:hypothetical protein